MNIRPFGWRDYSLLRNLLNRGLFLDSAQVLTHGSSLISMGALMHYLAPSTRTFTYRSDIATQSGSPLIGQMTYTMGASNARLTFLAPEDSLEQPEVSVITDFMAVQLGQMGAFHILADVDECSQVYELLHRAGFAIYARQRIWHLDGEPVADGEPSLWNTCRSKDVIGVRSLYCNIVPGLVQQVEPLPKKDVKGVVYYKDGELRAFVELRYGRNGIWLQPFIHPDAGDFDRYLPYFLRTLPGRGTRPLYICIRSYQSWLEPAIAAMGAKPGPAQAVMVRHLTVARTVNQAYSVPAINGKRVEPTAPIAQIDESGYMESVENEGRTRINTTS
jgi:hypothetical protein